MVQDQQAQLITHQGHIKVPMEKMYCLTFKAQKVSSALRAQITQPATHLALLLCSLGTWLAAAQNYCKFSTKVAIGDLWVMTGPWKLSPAMGQRIWHPKAGVATHTAWLSPFPVLTELSTRETAQAHNSPSKREHTASLPVPWSIPNMQKLSLEIKSLQYTECPN